MIYDALVSDRVYKKAYPHDTAYEMIRNGECGCFSPLLMEGLSRAKDKMKALYQRENRKRIRAGAVRAPGGCAFLMGYRFF